MEMFDTLTTYLELLNWGKDYLSGQEVDEDVARWLMLERLEMSHTDFIIQRNKTIPESDKEQYYQDIKKASNHYPPQYIVGREWFYGYAFQVNEATLIPRPETEEWFDRYIKALPDKKLTVVDVGTGSGVIGITHKLLRPQDTVILTDISKAALDVAKSNAQHLGADVLLLEGDTLEPLISRNISVDLLISNPPYISESEWNEMDHSVRTFEPKNALFATSNGLAIYERLLKQSSIVLSHNSSILLEIGYKQSEAVKKIIRQYYPQSDVELWTDVNGLDRVVKINV